MKPGYMHHNEDVQRKLRRHLVHLDCFVRLRLHGVKCQDVVSSFDRDSFMKAAMRR